MKKMNWLIKPVECLAKSVKKFDVINWVFCWHWCKTAILMTNNQKGHKYCLTSFFFPFGYFMLTIFKIDTIQFESMASAPWWYLFIIRPPIGFGLGWIWTYIPYSITRNFTNWAKPGGLSLKQLPSYFKFKVEISNTQRWNAVIHIDYELIKLQISITKLVNTNKRKMPAESCLKRPGIHCQGTKKQTRSNQVPAWIWSQQHWDA